MTGDWLLVANHMRMSSSTDVKETNLQDWCAALEQQIAELRQQNVDLQRQLAEVVAKLQLLEERGRLGKRRRSGTSGKRPDPNQQQLFA